MAEYPREAVAEHEFEEQEHRDLMPGINRIRDVAAVVGRAPARELSGAIRAVLDWIDTVLEPHIAWEDAWLYPQIDLRAGSPWATRLMRYEHRQMLLLGRQLVNDRAELAHEPGHRQIVELRARLFGLEALLRAHVEREERFLIPLLEDLPASVSPIEHVPA